MPSWTYYINPDSGELELDNTGRIRRDTSTASLVVFALRKARVIERIRREGAPSRGAIRESVKRALQPLEDAGRITNIEITIPVTKPPSIRIIVTDTELGGPVTTELANP